MRIARFGLHTASNASGDGEEFRERVAHLPLARENVEELVAVGVDVVRCEMPGVEHLECKNKRHGVRVVHLHCHRSVCELLAERRNQYAHTLLQGVPVTDGLWGPQPILMRQRDASAPAHGYRAAKASVATWAKW